VTVDHLIVNGSLDNVQLDKVLPNIVTNQSVDIEFHGHVHFDHLTINGDLEISSNRIDGIDVVALNASAVLLNANQTVLSSIEFTNGSTLQQSLTVGSLNGIKFEEIIPKGADLSNVTMTGNLKLPNGTAGDPAIKSASQTNTGIFFDSANNVVFSVAGTERMRINANGHKTVGTDSTTGSIMWLASGTTGWTYANSYGGYGWREIGGGMGWDVYQRGGSNFSTGNGRFTAPVSGFYHLTWQSYNYNDDNNTPNYVHLGFSRNGGTGAWSGRHPHGIWMHGTSSNHAGGVSMSLDLYLSSGEYTSQTFYWAGGPSRVHGSHSIFGGYMIG
jgi:hypothetical protein